MQNNRYHETLGVAENEGAAGIRRAFREHVKCFHPDRVGAARSGFFDAIIQAYHALSRSQQWQDRQPSAEAERAAETAPAGPQYSSGLPQLSRPMQATCIKDARFDLALAQISGNLTGGRTPAGFAAERLTVQVVLSAADALQGGIVDLALPSCAPCRHCGGAGRQGCFPCDACDGEGLRPEQEIVRIRVPANVSDGALIAVPLRGLGVHKYQLCARVRVVT